MTIKTMFSGKITAASWTFDWTDAANPGGTTLSITDGDYYVLGDGSADDLLAEMKTRVDAVATSTLNYTIADDGRVGFSVAAGTATISATAGGGSVALGAALGFTVATLPLTTAYTYSTNAAATIAVSPLPARVDIPTTMGRRSASEADFFNRSVLTLSSTVQRYSTAFRFDGPHRSSSHVAYYMWRSFFKEVIQPGVLCRWYPDVTQSTTAYVERTNPYGYHLGRVTSPTMFTPREVIPSWYRWYQIAIEFLEQSS